MEIGVKVIRKADLKIPTTAFGTLESIRGTQGIVRWHYNGRQQHSTLALKSLVEVTPEMERDIRKKFHEYLERKRAEQDAKFIYICNNVNPTARGSIYGHPKPLPLQDSQVVDGRCFYCGHTIEDYHGG